MTGMLVGGHLYKQSAQLPDANGGTLGGEDLSSTSISQIILSLSILSLNWSYCTAIVLTIWKRKHWKAFMETMFRLIDALNTNCSQTFDTQRMRRVSVAFLFVVTAYHLTFTWVFVVYYAMGVRSWYLIPLSYFMQTLTLSLCTFDLINCMYMLGDYFEMAAKVGESRWNDEYFLNFMDALDLIEILNDSHSYREMFIMATEFITILSQSFSLVYSPFSALGLFLGLYSIIPRWMKLFTISKIATRLTINVGRNFLLCCENIYIDY